SLLVPLVGCNSIFTKHVKCDDEAATVLVTQVLQNDLNELLDSELKKLINNGSIKDLEPAKLKILAKNIQFTLTDSRTDFIDPNSPKTTCSMDLVVTMPSDLVKRSDEARTKVNVVSVDAHANDLGVDYENNKIHLILEYVLQPTDKGDKILALLKNSSNVQTLLSETLTYAFLKPQIEKNQIKSLEANRVAAQPDYAVYTDADETVDTEGNMVEAAAVVEEDYN
ncbi:MAG: hypothetical protein PHW49_11300, partial [Acinetobacter harbinensis]|nr:hypothetical protein [Acinetobacter harbinensis]